MIWNLTGAYIASDANASKNSLTTGTLTVSDIHDHSDYSASSSGFSGGAGVGSTGKSTGQGSVSGSGGVAPMLSQHDSGSSDATTKSAIGAGSINITDAANQTQDVASINRDTTGLNGTVSKTPDLTNILSQQADMMNAAQAAGQTVAQGIGAYADKQRDDALAAAKTAILNNDPDGAQADLTQANSWNEGGANRVIAQIAGGALIGGLGGSSAFAGALGGAAGAGLSAAMANQTRTAANAVADATGSKLIGNISGNILAGVGGALIGGSAGAVAASNVSLYNQSNDKNETEAEKEEEADQKLIAKMRGMLGGVSYAPHENSTSPVLNPAPLVAGGLAGANGGTKGGVPAQLVNGQAAEASQLAALNSAGKVTFTPTQAQVNSPTFNLIVGQPKYTPSGDPVSTIYDGSTTAGLAEIKNGASLLGSSYQLRLQTYGAVVNNTPLTIYTSRPVNPTFGQWLFNWGVNVKPLPK